MILASAPFQQFFDDNGNPLAGGKLYSYASGTTTPLATYSNAGGTSNTNPIILDAAGRCDLWLDSANSYKLVLKTSADVTIKTVDTITTAGSVGTPSIADDAVTQAKIADDAVGSDQLRDDAVTDANRAVTTDHIRDSAVTTSKLASGAVTRSKIDALSRIPIGAIMSFAGTGDPSGWLLCDGRAVSRATYAALYTAIGITHGQGDNSTTFNIPDYRGRFLRGTDNMGSAAGAASRDPDSASRTAMATGGNTGNNVGAVQGSANLAHTHFVANSSSAGALNFPSLSASNSMQQRLSAGLGADYTLQGTSSTPDYGLTSSSGTESRPINASVNYVIHTGV
jgi:microcystin-dependent protein